MLLRKIIFTLAILCIINRNAAGQITLSPDNINDFISNKQKSLIQYIVNPQLFNKTQVQAWFDNISYLISELESEKRDNDSSAADLYHIVKNHSFFTDSPESWDILDGKFIVRFDSEISPAQRNQLKTILTESFSDLKNKFITGLNISPPKGLFFVWIFSSRERFTGLLKLSSEVGGLTYFCRFILQPRKFSYSHSLPNPDLKQFRETFMHELTHAWINSVTGYPGNQEIPKWFSEGTAIYLGGNKKIRITGQSTRQLSDEYKDYYDLFKYLKNDFGELKVNNFIKQSILNKNPESNLLNLTGGKGYKIYFGQKMQMFYMKSALGFLAILLTFFAASKIVKRFGWDISGTLLFLIASLSFLTFFNITGLILFSIHTGALYFFITGYIFFYSMSKYKFNRWIDSLNVKIKDKNRRIIEPLIEEILDKYRFISEIKRVKILPVLTRAVLNLNEIYRAEENFKDRKKFLKFLTNSLEESPNLVNRIELKDLFKIFRVDKDW